MTICLKYETVSPVVISSDIEKNFSALCGWREIDEERFYIFIMGENIDEVDIAKFVYQHYLKER